MYNINQSYINKIEAKTGIQFESKYEIKRKLCDNLPGNFNVDENKFINFNDIEDDREKLKALEAVKKSQDRYCKNYTLFYLL